MVRRDNVLWSRLLDLVCRVMTYDVACGDAGAAHDNFVAADAGAVSNDGGLQLDFFFCAVVGVAMREDARKGSDDNMGGIRLRSFRVLITSRARQ